MGWQNIGSTPVVLEAGILKGWGNIMMNKDWGVPESLKSNNRTM
jgi:hypothetical protein